MVQLAETEMMMEMEMEMETAKRKVPQRRKQMVNGMTQLGKRVESSASLEVKVEEIRIYAPPCISDGVALEA